MGLIKRAALRHPAPLAIAALSVLMTLVASFAANRWVERKAGDEFAYETERIAATIQQRLDTYQEMLRGLQGLFTSAPHIDRTGFRAYVDMLHLEQRYPGAQEFWFARHVSAAERPGYEARVRRELAALGKETNFAIQPVGERDDYLIVEYVYPLAENRRFLSTDLLTVPERKDTIARTRKTHQAALTERLSGMGELAHYAMVAAVPPSGGKEFPGTVSMVFRPAEIAVAAARQHNLADLHLEIYDNPEAAARGDVAQRILEYGGKNGAVQLASADQSARHQRTLSLKVGDREWVMVATALPKYNAAAMGAWLPLILLAGGFVVTLLLYFLTVFLVAARQQAESAFAGTFDFVPDGLLIVNESGQILRANPQIETLFGYGCGELIGQPIEVLLPQDRQVEHTSLRVEFFTKLNMRPMEAHHGDVFGRTKDGKVFPVDMELAPLQADGSKAVIAAVRDISDRVAAARALETANEALQREMQVKQDFLATMSHEIRTPLTGLLGILELLSFSALSDEQRHELAIARESGNSLARIIDDILDFSKIEAGRLQLSAQPEKLRELVESVRNAHLSVASAKGVTLMSFVDPRAHPALLLDGMRVKQILHNFVSNALKFTDEGYVEIRAEFVEQTENGDTLRFAVRDTGLGIASEAQAHLFECYTQADSCTARRYGGTGLGLSICKNLVDMMGGEIAVESHLGEGSVFSTTLTFPVAAENEVTVSAHPLAPEILSKLDSGSLPVLAVDDHPVNRTLLARQLGLLGLPVELAENGSQALAKFKLKSNRYCLIITDCHMPGMDGYELTRAVREFESQDGRPHIPIIAWTAAALHGEAERCHAAGMDDVLVKPNELGALRQTLSRWLPFAPIDKLLPAAPDAAPVVLEQDVLKALAGSMEVEAIIRRDFIAQTRLDLAALETALAANDFDAMAHEAHRIKGASMMVGAQVLAQRSGLLEGAAHRNNSQEASRRLAELQADFADLQAHFMYLFDAKKCAETVQVWDAQALTTMIGNSPQLLDELLNSFFTSSATLIAEIRSAYEKRELKSVAQIAHRLKSIATTIGALQLVATCDALGQAANDEDWPATSAAHDYLDEAYQRLAALHQRECKP